MTDIRACLADALGTELTMTDRPMLERLADVLLSLPGIAIVDTEADFVERAAARMADADDAIMPKSFYERMARVALAAAIQAQEEK